VIMNAAAALVAAGLAESFRQAAQLAGEAIRSGAAQAKLSALCAFTNTTQTE
jgi:anthranilate phosphoribosyltransferase